ncbi:MAG: zf-TFIIB domain-containing protein [Dehalococcoidia bacterium]|nr:zf-TFIIB domain-containing protein [Dehalococcoidia bacterium]MDW8009711.1 zf-TFIIB domain-containing protein [Chloroflexota bacterium]
MYCPKCNEQLRVGKRSGVTVDWCPRCRGVWLDRGELEKIIERETEYYSPYEEAYEREYEREYRPTDRPPPPYYGKPKKKKGFLRELFDFEFLD